MKAPSDDFFGIEYVYNSSEQSTSKPSTDAPSKPGSTTSEQQQVSGTEYLDDAFFPGLRERGERQQQVAVNGAEPCRAEGYGRGEGRGEEIEDQYFRRISEQEAQANRLAHDVVRPSVSEEERPPVNQRKPKVKKRATEYAVISEHDQEAPHSGLAELRASLLPVWHMTEEQLVDFLAQRVVYSDANLIAFDKPYGLSYAGGHEGELQFDKIIQRLKFEVAPKVERLHLVRPLDKHQSGIVLFATNKLIQSELKDMFKTDAAKIIHRCIVRRGEEAMPVNVTIPLVKKVTAGSGMKLAPLLSNKAKGEISYGETELKVLAANKNYVAYVEAKTKKEVPHQLRCHLGLAKMPMIGDTKYAESNGRPPKLAHIVLQQLGLTENQARRLPPYSHLMRMEFPSPNAKQAADIRISAPLPHHFTWILRKLRLLKMRR